MTSSLRALPVAGLRRAALLALLLAMLPAVPVRAETRSQDEFYVLENCAPPPQAEEQQRRLQRLSDWFSGHEVTASGLLLSGGGFTYRWLGTLPIAAPISSVWRFVESVDSYEDWVEMEPVGGIVRFCGVKTRAGQPGFVLYLHFGGVFQLWNAYPFHLATLSVGENKRAIFITFASNESMLQRMEVEAIFEEAPDAENVLVRYAIGLKLDWKEFFLSRRFIREELIPMASAFLVSLQRAVGGRT